MRSNPSRTTRFRRVKSAHDTFWDFVSLMPESAHRVLWTMSDRPLSRHYRFMEAVGRHLLADLERGPDTLGS